MALGHDTARWVGRSLTALALGAAVTTAVMTATSTAVAAPAAPAAGAIHPGVQMNTAQGQCTANFIYTDGSSTYIGMAAHCAGTGSETDTNGCTATSLQNGTPVTIAGASRPGTLAYSSWNAMHGVETDQNTCAGNDLALVRVDPTDVAKVSPTVPTFGGPKGVATGPLAGQQIRSYGNSQLRNGLASEKYGTVLSDDLGGWSHTVATVTPGIPGDSGSGFLTADGKAFGVLSTLNFLPGAGTNSVGDLSRELAYAQTHGLPGVTLRNG